MNHTKIEGAIVEVCGRCSNFGVLVDAPKEANYEPIRKPIAIADWDNGNLDLIPEYGKLILKKREEKGFSRYEFAKKINERESVIKRIEEEELELDEQLVKKIEKFLEIKLMEK